MDGLSNSPIDCCKGVVSDVLKLSVVIVHGNDRESVDKFTEIRIFFNRSRCFGNYEEPVLVGEYLGLGYVSLGTESVDSAVVIRSS